MIGYIFIYMKIKVLQNTFSFVHQKAFRFIPFLREGRERRPPLTRLPCGSGEKIAPFGCIFSPETLHGRIETRSRPLSSERNQIQ